MSFSELIISAVNKTVESFIDRIAEEYQISAQELRTIWGSTAKAKTSVKSEVKSEVKSDVKPAGSTSELSGMKKPELVAMCKARNLPITGTKDELIARITGGAPPSKDKKSPPKKTSSTPAKTSKVAAVVQTKVEPFTVSKNSFGNHEHKPTGLVLDKDTKKIIGTQNPKGHIDPLTDEGIETCNKYKLQYVLPENLNSKKVTVVEGLPEEEEEDVGEDLIDDVGEDEEVGEEFEDEELLEDEEEFVDE